MPEFDRDRGSGRVDQLIRFLLDDGWNVTFLADEENPDPRHQRRLQRLGVATFAGYHQAVDVIRNGHFELAIVAFWKQASVLAPLIREHSPETKIVVDSIDLHFLREARRSFGVHGRLDDVFADAMAAELNTYRSVDAVLAVSAKETTMLADFIGDHRVFEVALAEHGERSAVSFEERRGMVFVGNFRHLPNGEAVEYLCKDVLPRLDPRLLAAHPLTVIGNRLDGNIRKHATGLPNVQMVGWVPTIRPYLERARLAVVPLLHGAGVKGKVIEAMVTGTPVVTTPIGAEGLGLTNGHDAFVAEDASSLAACIVRLLLDRDVWQRLADRGVETISTRNTVSDVRLQFMAAIDRVMNARAHTSTHDAGFRHGRHRLDAYRDNVTAVARVIEQVTDPGSVVAVTSRGDDDLVEFRGRTGWHFPRHATGEWAGFHPADSEEAVAHLQALREAGASYLALPSSAFWWLHHYSALAAHLEENHRRIHADADAIVFDLRTSRHDHRHEELQPVADDRRRVLVVGVHDERAGGPSASLVAELSSSRRFHVSQHWDSAPASDAAGAVAQRLDALLRRASTDANAEHEWIVAVDAVADLPSGFLDDFLELQIELGAARAQPAHLSGPAQADPITERLHGCVAREVSQWTTMPVRSIRSGAAIDGPVVLLDATPIALTAPVRGIEHGEITDVYTRSTRGDLRRTVVHPVVPSLPRISVLVATFERPELLRGCLQSFCEQTIDERDFEIVVVDDGSDGPETAAVVDEFSRRVPMTSVRLEHAGRSAAKNMGVMLARADIVLFFDDDDRAAPDLLAEHLSAHAQFADPAAAVLGYTDWAPELEVTPLMHFLTDVDKLLFAYGNLTDGQVLDWKGFWEGRLSCKRAFLLDHALHDQRLLYSIDVEMGYRLAPFGLHVRYHAGARSHMARSIDFDQFCTRIEAKGRAQANIALLHDDPVIRSYTKIDAAPAQWDAARPTLPIAVTRIREIEDAFASGCSPDAESDLYRRYREVFAAFYAKGVVSSLRGVDETIDVAQAQVRTEPAALPACGTTASPSVTPPIPPSPTDSAPPAEPARSGSSSPARSSPPVTPALPSSGSTSPRLVSRADDRDWTAAPLLTVTIPVWSRTAELAAMAQRTVDRVRDVASISTEIVVIDNGSPFEVPLRADVHRFAQNRGVSIGWNAGIALARADVIAVMNSDCLVEPGWDVALYEAVCDGRRIAFPYTDHVDGAGYRCPDQAGTAGWCFMMSKAVIGEVGLFDEQFSPAFGEDTDYWHRAWELGIELSPVPAARVTHARRTTGGTDPHIEWLLQAHRYKYGWKHGVDPLRAPPYYNREVLEYVARGAPA